MRMRSVAIGVGTVLACAAPSLAGTGIFRTAYTEIASGNATGIAVGDFDGDGTVDVVTANAGLGGNELTILVGFSDGTVSRTGQVVPLNGVPAGMIQAKFDEDALDDVIVANGTDASISFLRGLGNNDYFAPPGPSITVGQSPTGFAAADLTGDGVLDLVVANEGGGGSSPGSVSILRGEGDGTFVLLAQPDPQEPGETLDALPAELGTRDAVIGDVTGSSALDIIAVNSLDDSISIYTGQGNGVFAPLRVVEVGAAPQDAALSDVNGDGRLDLIIADGNADQIEVRLGDTNAMFAQVQTYPVGTAPTRLVLADMNGDTRLDVVVSNSRSGDVSVLLARTGGTFEAARSFVSDGEPQVLAVIDMNEDDKLDVVSGTQGSDEGPSVAILRNRDNGMLHGVEDLKVSNGPSALATADLDDDAFPDLVVSGETGEVGILYGGPAGLSTALVGLSVGGRSLGVLALDLTGDTLPDLAIVDSENSRIAVLRNIGERQFATAATFATSPNPNAITSGDFNNDGRPDLAVTALGSDRTCRGGAEPGMSCMQDDDCEGGICTAPGFASVLLQQSNGQFGPARATPVEETPLGIASLDANCDGRDDLVVANEASNTISILRSSGDGTFTIPQTIPQAQAGQGPIAVVAADFNRDGVGDFAVSNFVTPLGLASLRIFTGNCSGPFQLVTQSGQLRPGDQVVSIVARDFTGDQIVDIAVVNQTGNAIRVVTGIGDGRFAFTPQNDGVSRMPIAIAAADFDIDGRYDVVTANSDASANNVSLLSNCARDPGCDPFRPGPPGEAALRGDGNNDGARSAADLVAVSAEVMDDDGDQVEDIAMGDFGGERVSPGVDANGDGRVDAQDRRAVAHRLFSGA
jgi:hypothetical protein